MVKLAECFTPNDWTDALEAFMFVIMDAPREKINGISYIKEDYFAKAANMAHASLTARQMWDQNGNWIGD